MQGQLMRQKKFVQEEMLKKNELNSDLISAIVQIYPDFNEIKNLIKNGADVNYADNYGKTPLMRACWSSTAPVIVEYLIEKGALVNAVDYKGATSLFYIINDTLKSGHSIEFNKKAEEILKILIKNRADLDHKDNEGYRFIHKVIQINNSEMLKILIDAGCDINCKFNYGTPLCIAKKLGRNELVKLLEEAGAIDAE
jgi:ankyrin repeat protein